MNQTVYPSKWFRRLVLALGGGLLLSVVSSSASDPNWFNLHTGPNGVYNWLWVVGAMTGGSLVALFGAGALLAPLMLLHRPFSPYPRARLAPYLAHGLAAALFFSTLQGLAWLALAANPDPNGFTQGLFGPGAAGLACALWLQGSVGAGFGLLVAMVGLGLSLQQLFRAFSPARLALALLTSLGLGLLALGRGLGLGAAGLAAMARQGGGALKQQAAQWRAARRQPIRVRQGWLERLALPFRGWRWRLPGRLTPTGRQNGQPKTPKAAPPARSPAARDGLDSWFEQERPLEPRREPPGGPKKPGF